LSRLLASSSPALPVIADSQFQPGQLQAGLFQAGQV
jgi:hypothetical protein